MTGATSAKSQAKGAMSRDQAAAMARRKSVRMSLLPPNLLDKSEKDLVDYV